MKNRCYNCKFFACQDTGYSNYTVEGTDIFCLKKHFEMTEESYSWRGKTEDDDSEFFKRAETCPDFKKEEGIQVNFDVDGETTMEDYNDEAEIYQALKEYYSDGDI
jgi:hypothetical protein